MNINNTYFNRILKDNTQKLTAYTDKLTTGKRINSASDDSAALQISTRLTAQNKGNTQSIRNIQDGISLLKTTDGSLSIIQDMLQRVRELAVQGKNGTYSNEQKLSIKGEIKHILDEIDRISKTEKFNGIPLLTNGRAAVFSGDENENQRINIDNVPVNTSPDAKTTVEFWMYWDGQFSMPFSWEGAYDIYVTPEAIGFNTGQGNILGVPVKNIENEWMHVSATFVNGVPNPDNVELFINGKKQDVREIRPNNPTNRSKTVTSSIILGGLTNTGNYDYGGKIDELKIWDGERTESQVRDGMNKILSGDEENLLGYWNFNDASITDHSVNGNNGTLINGTYIGDGITEPVKIHTGNGSNNEDWIGLPSISASALNLENINLNSPNFLKSIDNAISVISKQRGNLGAKINRYEYKLENLHNTIKNTEAARMRIEDLDMANAMSELTKSEVLMNSAQRMLKTNNSMYEEKMRMLVS